jgi:NAD(P)-dependent dehydrogenase (short-subunit alcohol dehydrogenase family)
VHVITEPRIVVVTGANRGIGREVARQCASRGDTVLLGARDLAAGERAARELQPGVRGRIRGVRLDVARGGLRDQRRRVALIVQSTPTTAATAASNNSAPA